MAVMVSSATVMLAACGGGKESGVSDAAAEGIASALARKGPKAKQAAPAPTGSATVTWTPPTLNMDGSTATDITGFRIYYGTSASDLAQSVDVTSSTVTSYTVTGLATGTYYFAVSAVNSAGVTSRRTNLVSTVIQ
jgi:hypothetical protein